ncbi:hypothetical protein [Tiger frog virus]|uniref:Uncharacterized protein n=1 Tax=Rana tigrina ranavirus TaxID=160691 RepID=A0A6M8PGA3_RTRV|nr:hypothetical protein [Tiger frog virus]
MTATRGPVEQRDQPDPLVHPVTSVRSGPWDRLGLRGRGESGALRETLELWAGQEGLISRVQENPRETWDRQGRPDLWPRVGGRDTPSRVHVRHSVCGSPRLVRGGSCGRSVNQGSGRSQGSRQFGRNEGPIGPRSGGSNRSQRGAWISGSGRRRGRYGARWPKGIRRSRRPKGTSGIRNILTGMYLESVSRGLLSSRD